MATAKTAYTVDQTTALVAAYKAAPTAETVAVFAETFGKSVKSVVAKLSREGVYQKKAYVTKSGATPVRKEAIADELQAVFNLSEAEADSLAKANKTALLKILAAVKG